MELHLAPGIWFGENTTVIDTDKDLGDATLQESTCTTGGGGIGSSVVRAFAHGTMDRRINPLWWSYFSFQPVIHEGVTKAVVCTVLSVGWCI